MDTICDYDEGYDRVDAYEIGWCCGCKCNPKCPYKKKAEEDSRGKSNGKLECGRSLGSNLRTVRY